MKGGHLLTQRQGGQRSVAGELEAIDVLNEEGKVTILRAELVSGGEVHGSGCTLSAAIAACLALGMSLGEAVETAKHYITTAIKNAPAIGNGSRPLFL